MEIKTINTTPFRNTKLYSKIQKLCNCFHQNEKGIVDMIFFLSMTKKELSFIYKHASLPQKWIHDNRNIINWDIISSYQHMTIDFIKEHKEYINFDRIFERNKYIRDYPDYCTLYETYYMMKKN